MNLFFVRPTSRNIGNILIAHATRELFYEVFGDEVNIINVPTLKGVQFGGLVASQIYDMNRLADAVVVGGGNLFENGQLSYNSQAIDALNPPMILLGISHGRIAGRDGGQKNRTDSLPPETIRHLVRRSVLALVRDDASREILRSFGIEVEVGGCPTLFLSPNPEGEKPAGDILISIRHPTRMCVPPPLQWRIAEDLRRLICVLRAEYSVPIRLACHNYIDLEFAAGFLDATPAYFDDVGRYITALRRCTLHVSYRLHGFLPCLAFGTHSIHLSYDERGRSMLGTIGLENWDIDLLREPDCVAAVMDRAKAHDRYQIERQAALQRIAGLRRITIAGLMKLKGQIDPAVLAGKK